MAEPQKRAINILVGVGGTGAKVVEATLIQLLSGMVSDPVHVGLVDQDLANGNAARTVALLSRQVRFHRLWSEGKNSIVWNSGDMPALGSTGIFPLYSSKSEIDAIYRPNSAGSNLHQMLARGLSTPQAHLFDMLFMDNEEEQHLQLDEGYRGRAHVGSAAFISALANGQNKLFDAIRRIAESSAGTPINVFFAGSAFGGTGAAGFPTLARRLHRLREEKAFANAQNIRIGGLLMLPYFHFASPDEGVEAVVTPDELLPKTQLALEYYQNLFKNEPCFNMFYALGWPEQYPLGYHEPGANEQANPALPTEMIAATAAVHFFRNANDYAEESATTSFLSAHDDSWIDWRDLPNDAPTENENMRKLGQLLRFCAYWRFLFEPELSKKVGGLLSRRNWAHKLADDAHPADAPEEMEVLRELIDSILTWFATMDATAGRVPGGQRLWSLAKLVDPEHTATPIAPIRIPEAIDRKQWEPAFDNLLIKGDSGVDQRSATAVYDGLVSGTAPANHSGIGKAVVRVYDACRI